MTDSSRFIIIITTTIIIIIILIINKLNNFTFNNFIITLEVMIEVIDYMLLLLASQCILVLPLLTYHTDDLSPQALYSA